LMVGYTKCLVDAGFYDKDVAYGRRSFVMVAALYAGKSCRMNVIEDDLVLGGGSIAMK